MKVITNYKTTLSASMTSSQATVPVSSVTTTDGTTITAALFDSVAYLVIEPGAANMEIVKVTGVSGLNFTGAIRGLAFSGGTETAVAANKKAHQAGSTVIMTNAHYYFDKLMDLDSDETVTGTKTFTDPNYPRMDDATAGPTDDEQLATKKYVDETATGTTNVDKLITKATAGATIAAGDVVYFDETAKEWLLADGSATGTADDVLMGIAQGAGTDGVLISGGVLLYGLDANQSGFTAGDIIYLSDTGGALSASAGTVEVVVGYAHSATEVFFAPTYFRVSPTKDEKAALAGSSGVPDTNNKYLTENDAEDDGVDQSQTTQDANVNVGEADATTKHNSIAQSFVADRTSQTGVKLWKEADDGTFTGDVTVELLADDGSDAPTGAALATVTILNAAWAALSNAAEFTATYASAYAATIGTKYWIKISTSTADNTNFINLGTNSAGGYASGSVKFNNTTDGWSAIATIDLYFKTLTTMVGKLARKDSNGDVIVPTTPTDDDAAASKNYVDNSSFNKKLSTSATPVDTHSTATTTNLMTFSLAANSLSTNNAVEIYIPISDMDYDLDAQTITIDLIYGSTTLATATITTSGTAFTEGKGYIKALLIADGDTAAQRGIIELNTSADYYHASTSSTTTYGVRLYDSGTATEDSTGALTLTILYTHNNNRAAFGLTTDGYIAKLIK